MDLNYRADVDGLRAVAVLAVLAFHGFPELVPGGFTGVDIFFVISGYLISGIIMGALERGSFSFAGFYARRIRRIFPALFVVMATLLVVGWFVLIPDEYKKVAKHASAAAGFFLNFVLWRESGYFDTAARLKPLLHLWSLAIEEQFYIGWPLLLWAAWRWARGFLWLILGGIACSFAVNMVQVQTHPESAFFLPLSRFWELLLGSLAAYVELHHRTAVDARLESLLRLSRLPLRLADAKSLAGGVLVAAGIVILSDADAFPGAWALLPTLGAYLLISAGPDGWLNRVLLARPALVGVGLVSYPLYLWHWPLLSIASMIALGRPLSTALTLSLLALSGALAWGTYEFVEKPIRFGARPRSASAPDWRVRGLAGAMSALAAVGVWISAHKGYPGRFPESIAVRGQLRALKAHPVDEDCERFVNLSDRSFEYCKMKQGTSPDLVAIIGDSHARNLFTGVSEKFAGQGMGVVLLASAGCPPLAGTTVGKREKDRSHCAHKTEQILRVAESKSEIKVVILATRGPLYLTGNGFGDIDRHKLVSAIVATDGTEDGQGPRATFKEGLRRTVEAFTKNGVKVYYLLEVPELGFVPAACFERPAWLRSDHACEIARSEVDARQADYRAAVLELANDVPGLTVVDPFPLFCDADRCRAREGDRLLYEDDDHVSVDGGRLVATHLF